MLLGGSGTLGLGFIVSRVISKVYLYWSPFIAPIKVHIAPEPPSIQYGLEFGLGAAVQLFSPVADQK